MKLPNELQCLKYFEEYKVPDNIFQHCLLVRKISIFLANELKKSGMDINIELVECASLLHDLFKMASLKTLESNQFYQNNFTEEEVEMWKKLKETYPEKHENEIAYEIFKEEYPELALALKNVSDPHKRDKTWEEMVSQYGDWRVFQTKIVSISERLAYLKERYPRPKENWDNYSQFMLLMEKFIFSHLNFTPEKVAEMMENGK